METAASQAHGACPVLPRELEAVTVAGGGTGVLSRAVGITGAALRTPSCSLSQQTGVWLLSEPFCGSELTCAPLKST